MSLLPLSLTRTRPLTPIQHVPSNEDRIRAWRAAQPVHFGNAIKWPWLPK